MHEPKTIIMGAALILLGLLVFALFVDKGINLSEKHELEINISWDDGYSWGFMDGSNMQVFGISEKLMENGWVGIDANLTDDSKILAFTIEGCMAQIEYEGCEVVCAGP